MNTTAPLLTRIVSGSSSYLRRPLLMAVCGGVIALWGLILAGSGGPNQSTPVLIFLAPPVCLCAAAWSLHAQSVFARPEARLVPGYRVAHLVAIGGPVILGIGVVAVCSWAKLGVSGVGVAAATTTVVALLLWAVHAGSGTSALLAMFLVFANGSPVLAGFWCDPQLPHFGARLTILLAAAGLIGYWLRSLATLDEESDRGRIPPIAAGLAQASRGERAEQRKLQVRQITNPAAAWIIDRDLDRFFASSPTPTRLLKRSIAPLNAVWRGLWFACTIGIVCFCFIAGMMYLSIGRLGDDANGAMIGALAVPAFFACFMPGMLLSQLITMRRGMMGQELLRPLTRASYYDTLIEGGIRDTLVQAVAMLAVLLPVACWLVPEQITLARLAMFIVIALASNFFIAAFILWTSRWQLGFFNLFVIMAPAFLIEALLGGWVFLHNDYTHAPFLLAALVLALCGGGLLKAARRTWFAAELN